MPSNDGRSDLAGAGHNQGLTVKTSTIERDALAIAGLPRQTKAEAETAKFLAEMDTIAIAINATPSDVRMERCAAVLAGIVKPADAEAVRAAYWMRLPLPVRMVAVMAGKMKKERAHDALRTFNAFERGTMWCAIEKLQGNLLVAQKCCNGGAMPSPTAGAVH